MRWDELEAFYVNKRVFVTGHTGFKGSWLCEVLLMLGAEVYGYALCPDSETSLFDILGLESRLHHECEDIRNFEMLENVYKEAKPDVVFHLAAQPIVRESYKNPRYTYETNVMGTVNILECLRTIPGAVSFVNVTTDKVYENSDLSGHAFSEDEKLDGYDPYSNSKSCSELVTHSYNKSFFKDGAAKPAVSTMRAGNVIGGGDFAADRIIPDCVRATIKNEAIKVRNPFSTRPYQHVLEPVFAYLWVAMKQAGEPALADYYNVGPKVSDCFTTGELADEFVKNWGDGALWEDISEKDAPHEASFLQLDCTKIRNKLDISPKWDAKRAVLETVNWYKAWNMGEDMEAYTKKQIREYME